MALARIAPPPRRLRNPSIIGLRSAPSDGRHGDEFGGAGRGGVRVQAGQCGHGREPDRASASPGRPGPRSPTRPAWPPMVARASIASARTRSSTIADRATSRSAPQAASSFQAPARRMAGSRSGDPVGVEDAAMRPTSLSRSLSGFNPRVAAASARASIAFARIDGGTHRVERPLIDEAEVRDAAAPADHLDDRALALRGHTPALEQLHHRAVGRRFIRGRSGGHRWDRRE